MGEKSYRHKYFIRRIFCDDKVENHQKTCFKTAGANGKVDIYWGSIRKYKKV
jgi:hypothetical protein